MRGENMNIPSLIEQRRQFYGQNINFKELLLLLDYYLDFFETTSFQVKEHLIIFNTNNRLYCYQHEHIDSVVSTLDNLKHCLEKGYFSDANILLRKINDDLFFYLFILELHNNNGFDMQDKTAMQYFINWYNNKLKNFYTRKNAIPYIKKNQAIKAIIEQNYLEKIWSTIINRLNDFVHNNGREYTVSNFRRLDDLQVKKMSNLMVDHINTLFNTFITLMVIIKPYFIMSSDYITYLDCNTESPEDSQYWISSYIQDHFDTHLLKYNPEIKVFLKNNIYMQID